MLKQVASPFALPRGLITVTVVISPSLGQVGSAALLVVVVVVGLSLLSFPGLGNEAQVGGLMKAKRSLRGRSSRSFEVHGDQRVREADRQTRPKSGRRGHMKAPKAEQKRVTQGTRGALGAREESAMMGQTHRVIQLRPSSSGSVQSSRATGQLVPG
ncbi:hypothetical protein B7463_g1834, partial [Scytalidium lignicola]